LSSAPEGNPPAPRSSTIAEFNGSRSSPGGETGMTAGKGLLLHCESLTLLIDIHVIEKRCGRIDNHIEAQGFDQLTRCSAA